jgi:ATP-dependent Clp protease ATP-binding subunit ClpC
MKTKITDKVKKVFNPEFLNRVDDVIVFRPLLTDDMLKIVELEFKEILEKLSERKITVKLSTGAKKFLAEKGYDPVLGARPLKRAIQKYIEDTLAEDLLKGKFNDGETIKVVVKGDKLGFTSSQNSPMSLTKE